MSACRFRRFRRSLLVSAFCAARIRCPFSSESESYAGSSSKRELSATAQFVSPSIMNDTHIWWPSRSAGGTLLCSQTRVAGRWRSKMGELDLQTLDTARPPQDRAIKTFPQDRQAKRDLLLS